MDDTAIIVQHGRFAIDMQFTIIVFDGAFKVFFLTAGNSSVVKVFGDLQVSLIGLVNSRHGKSILGIDV
jgi:hypothetical protein